MAKQTRFGVPLLIARTWILGFSPVFHTPKVIRSRRLTRLNEKFSALVILYRLRLWRFTRLTASSYGKIKLY